MASFINAAAPKGWYPRIGEQVVGRKGHQVVHGVVAESKKHPGKPAIFSRHGFVGLYIVTDGGKQVCVNEVRPAFAAEEKFEDSGAVTEQEKKEWLEICYKNPLPRIEF